MAKKRKPRGDPRLAAALETAISGQQPILDLASLVEMMDPEILRARIAVLDKQLDALRVLLRSAVARRG